MHDRLVAPRITADAFDHHGLATSGPKRNEAKRTDADLESYYISWRVACYARGT